MSMKLHLTLQLVISLDPLEYQCKQQLMDTTYVDVVVCLLLGMKKQKYARKFVERNKFRETFFTHVCYV